MKFEFLDFDVETAVLLPPPLLRHLLRLHHRRRPRLPPPRQPHPPIGNQINYYLTNLQISYGESSL